MKIYNLDINSVVSTKKYWLYCIDNDNHLFNTIHATDSYHEIRIIMDLYGLKISSIYIHRENSFPSYLKTRNNRQVFVKLKK